MRRLKEVFGSLLKNGIHFLNTHKFKISSVFREIPQKENYQSCENSFCYIVNTLYITNTIYLPILPFLSLKMPSTPGLEITVALSLSVAFSFSSPPYRWFPLLEAAVVCVGFLSVPVPEPGPVPSPIARGSLPPPVLD